MNSLYDVGFETKFLVLPISLLLVQGSNLYVVADFEIGPDKGLAVYGLTSQQQQTFDEESSLYVVCSYWIVIPWNELNDSSAYSGQEAVPFAQIDFGQEAASSKHLKT